MYYANDAILALLLVYYYNLSEIGRKGPAVIPGLDGELRWVGVEVARLAASHRSDSDLTSEFALIHEGRQNGSIVPFIVKATPLIFYFTSSRVTKYGLISNHLRECISTFFSFAAHFLNDLISNLTLIQAYLYN